MLARKTRSAMLMDPYLLPTDDPSLTTIPAVSNYPVQESDQMRLPRASRAHWTAARVTSGDYSLTKSPLVLAVQLTFTIMDKLLILSYIVEAVVRHNVSSSATMRSDTGRSGLGLLVVCFW